MLSLPQQQYQQQQPAAATTTTIATAAGLQYVHTYTLITANEEP